VKKKPKRCYARRHGRRIVVRCPKPKPKPKTKRVTTTTTTHRTTTASHPPAPVITTTSTTTSATSVDYCTLYGLPHATEVDESDQGDGTYLLSPACPRLASGSERFNVYNFDSQAHNFVVRNGSGQSQTLTFAGGGTGTALSLGPAPAGSSSTASATVSLPPGTYTLLCTIHPGMQATISVG
jgi:plastocyanin